MATLDIFANNIIGDTDSVSNMNQDENPFRWVKIKSANFFIVKKLNSNDSLAVSNIIDSVTQGDIIFDSNGNLRAKLQLNNNVVVNILNPILSSEINVINNKNKKNFSDLTSEGYCSDKNNIFSIPGLKWILHRDDSKNMYILYNPMHTKNVKDYYNSVKASNLKGNPSSKMSNLIQQYTNTFQIRPISEGTTAIFSEPSCYCFSSERNCTNDYAGFYLNDTDSNLVGWNCTCGAPSCKAELIDDETSFLPNFIKKAQDLSNINDCSAKITICKMDIRTQGGSVNFTDSQLTQKCKFNEGTPTQPPIQSPKTQPPTTQPPTTQPPLPSKTSSKLPIIIGSSVGGLVLIIIMFIIYKKME